jgi:2-amino-4-hydroxy-6-hydroxymethyldihydropteridine diphosphokinase
VGDTAHTSANYLNAIIVCDTPSEAERLKNDILVPIENRLGRTRDPESEVPIDLDIILFNDAQFQLGKRQIPAPDIYERAYVAVPLADVAPELSHPATGEMFQQIAERFWDDPSVTLRTDIVLNF